MERQILRLARGLRLRGLRHAAGLQRIANSGLHRSQLDAEAVDLFVLRASHITLLGEQRLLEGAQRRTKFDPRALRAAAELIAQLALEALRTAAERVDQCLLARVGVGVAALSQAQPQHQQHRQDRQRQHSPQQGFTH